jgi:TetR/AcrR family transcriptional repressor of nem operon
MGNLASELSDVHEGFRRRLAGIFVRWRDKLTDAIGRGQAMGRIRPDGDAAGLAQFIVAALEGAILLTKVTKDIAVMEQCVTHLGRHLTLYTTSRLADDDRVAELVQGGPNELPHG